MSDDVMTVMSIRLALINGKADVGVSFHDDGKHVLSMHCLALAVDAAEAAAAAWVWEGASSEEEARDEA